MPIITLKHTAEHNATIPTVESSLIITFLLGGKLLSTFFSTILPQFGQNQPHH